MLEIKEKNFISAVVYVHNSENYIREFLEKILECLKNNFEKYEIICVNDSSSDKSTDIIKEVGKSVETSIINIINMSYFQGVEKSMLAGVDLAIGDFVFEFDSTIIDYDINEIMNVYKKSLQGFDIVSASSNKKMKITSRLFYKIFNNNVLDMKTESFRILSRRAINRINIISSNIVYRKAVYYNSGLKTSNIVYEVKKKIKENSNETRYRRRLAVDSMIYFTNIGFKISFILAAIMMAFSILGFIYTMLVYLWLKNPIEGWTTMMIFMSFGFFGLFLLLSILIKYASLILETTHQKQKYVFESIVKVNKN